MLPHRFFYPFSLEFVINFSAVRVLTSVSLCYKLLSFFMKWICHYHVVFKVDIGGCILSICSVGCLVLQQQVCVAVLNKILLWCGKAE